MGCHFLNLCLIHKDWWVIWFVSFLEKIIDSDFAGLKDTSHFFAHKGIL